MVRGDKQNPVTQMHVSDDDCLRHRAPPPFRAWAIKTRRTDSALSARRVNSLTIPRSQTKRPGEPKSLSPGHIMEWSIVFAYSLSYQLLPPRLKQNPLQEAAWESPNAPQVGQTTSISNKDVQGCRQVCKCLSCKGLQYHSPQFLVSFPTT